MGNLCAMGTFPWSLIQKHVYLLYVVMNMFDRFLSFLVMNFVILILMICGHFCNQSLQVLFGLFNILLTIPDNGDSSTSDASLFQVD